MSIPDADPRRKRIGRLLEELLRTPSPPGYCEKAMDLVKGRLAGLGVGVSETRRQALFATVPGDSSDGLLLCAHLDTLAAMIRSIDGDGVIRIRPLGGFTASSIEGEYCTVETHAGTMLTGTIVHDRTSVHIFGREEASKPCDFDDLHLRLDAEAESREQVEGLGVCVGDYVHLDTRTVFTGSGYIKSRHLDDKASAVVLLEVASELRSGAGPGRDVHLLFTGYEEVGHGASVAMPPGVTDLIAVDVGIVGKGQQSSERAVSVCAADSTGPFSYGLVRRIADLAERTGVPWRMDTFQRYGSDTMAALRTGMDVRHALVGPAVDGSHSLERTHYDGIAASIDLLVAFARLEDWGA